MPIRPVTSRRPSHNMLRTLALGLAITLASLTMAESAGSQSVNEISLDQARQLAVHALQTGDPGLAIQLSRGLLRADPRDPLAYYVIAQAHAGLNQPNLGRRAAALAYRFADTGSARFRAAQLAARMAFVEGKPSLAQIWLRRTAIHAPSRREKALIGRDYRALRALNPWSLSLRTDLRPSSNINNGADTALQIIDGVPVTGNLSGTAQALSGVIGSIDITSAYRLRADDRSATSIGGRIYLQRLRLSSAAKDLAPTAQNADFSSSYGELSLRHGFGVGPSENGGSAVVELALGESWSAGQRSYRFGRIRATREWRVDGARTSLALNAMAERRAKARFRTHDARILGVGGAVRHRLDNGDSLGLSIALRDSAADHHNGTFASASVRASYAFAKPVGPARLSAGLVLGYSDYPLYRSGIFMVPGGRQDKSIYGDLSLFFDQLDYAGFAPMLRIRTGRKSSNDSRFDTREFSVSLSVQSKF